MNENRNQFCFLKNLFYLEKTIVSRQTFHKNTIILAWRVKKFLDLNIRISKVLAFLRIFSIKRKFLSKIFRALWAKITATDVNCPKIKNWGSWPFFSCFCAPRIKHKNVTLDNLEGFHWNSTGGIQISFLGVYIPLEGFSYHSKGFIIPLEGFRYPSWGFIIPLEGLSYPS